MKSLLVIGVAAALFLMPPATGKKKNKEEVTQVLEAPPDPPAAVAAETRRLVFHVSPLEGKGLLSQQTRDALRALLRENGGLPIVKLRAFVAGTGDLRRVSQIVSEMLAEKRHGQLPAVSTVQAGGLPMEGAQVVLEAISVARHEVNPQGLLFVAGRERSGNAGTETKMAAESLADLATKLAGKGEALRVTCFSTTMDDSSRMRSEMAARFPGAALDLVQTQRASARSSVACEGIARAIGSAGTEPGLVNADRVVLTGIQVAYGLREDDARLAFQRLDRVLAPFGASTKTAAMVNVYPLSHSIAALVTRLKPQFTDPEHPAVWTMLPWESLPGMDSSFAVEAVAAARREPSQ